MGGKRRLGKGLAALIPDYSEPQNLPVERFGEIPVDQIEPNPYQPREEFDPHALEELKRSISEKGVVQPITVRKKDGGYQLVAGERRLRAVKELGYAQIPAYIIRVESDDEMLELALIENIQREDLNPIDVARAYERLINECHLTQEEVAQKVGKDRSTVTNFLRLLKLPVEIQESLRKKELSMGHARALLSVEDRDLQLKLWKKVVRQNLSVRRIEQIVRSLQEGKTGETRPRQPKRTPQIIHVEDKFREVFGTQVRIYPKKEGGKIEIEYYSDADLERIYNILVEKERAL
jgi:ParB family chromosome partitioning protein